MSSTPKYTRVAVNGSAASTVAKAVSDVSQRWEAARQQKRTMRLQREQAEIVTDSRELGQAITTLAHEATAAGISIDLKDMHRRCAACQAASTVDLTATGSVIGELGRIQRELRSARRHFESTRLVKALDGVAGELAGIQTEVEQLDDRDCERFDPGKLADIKQSLARAQRGLSARQLGGVQIIVAELRKLLKNHVQRVQSGRNAYEQERLLSQQAIATLSDRCDAITAEPTTAHYFQADIAKLRLEIGSLESLHRADQFSIVCQQATRLDSRLDEIVVTAKAKVERVERQKVITERMIATVISARGVLLAGYPQQENGMPAIVRFRVQGAGVLHVEISPDGPVVVHAEGFRHHQQYSPQGKLEKTCDEFVEWFEQIRSLAREQGLELGALQWDGQPPPERARAIRHNHYSTRTVNTATKRGIR